MQSSDQEKQNESSRAAMWAEATLLLVLLSAPNMQSRVLAPAFQVPSSERGVDRADQGQGVSRTGQPAMTILAKDKGIDIPTPHVGVLPPRSKSNRATDETIEMEELRLQKEDTETRRRMQICSDC